MNLNKKHLVSKVLIAIFLGYFFVRIFFSSPFPKQQRTEEVNIRRLITPVCQVKDEQRETAIVKTITDEQEKTGESSYGIASWYGLPFHGRKMANGKIFDMNNPVYAAHRTLPFGTKLEITNLANRKKLVVIVLDRGPFTKNKQGKYARDIDLSLAGATQLGFKDQGLANVVIKNY